MMKFVFIVCGVIGFAAVSPADSLWDQNFEGYIAGMSAFKAGDIVTIVIDSGFSLAFSSASKDAKSITFEFGGGNYGNLFTFLPVTKTGAEGTVSGKETYAFKTELAARVVDIDPTGKLVLSGTRTMQFEGKQETVTIAGRVDPKAVGSAKRVKFASIENTSLSFSSFLQPQTNTLSAQDIQETITEITTGPTGEKKQQVTTALTDAKKRELVLRYLNRLLDILF
jgi:flagellar basal body L-ring protein FlgH